VASLSLYQHGGADQQSTPVRTNISPPFAGIFNSSNVYFVLQSVAKETNILVLNP
jgi:hypothetical protein